MAHANDGEGQILLVARGLVREEERDGTFELTHLQLSWCCKDQLEKPSDKLSEFLVHTVTGERGPSINTFDFLDVKTDLLDAVADIEVEQPVGMVERGFGQHCDHMKGQLLILQEVDSAHHPVERSMAAARASMHIVEVRRTVDAQPDLCSRSREEAHPILIKQEAIGLEEMLELHLSGAPLCHQCERVLVPSQRNSKRFSAMPGNLKLAIEVRALENALAHEIERRETHPGP